MTRLKYSAWWLFGLFTLAIMTFDITTGKVDNKTDISTLVAQVAPAFVCVAGIYMWKPRHRAAWWLWAGGWIALAIGNILSWQHIPANVTTPSIRDVFYISQYIYLGLALVLLVWAREDRRDLIALTAGVIIILGISAVTFGTTFVSISNGDGTVGFRVQQIMYVVVQMIFFATVLRLYTSSGSHSPAFWLVLIMGGLIAAGSFTENEMQGVYASGGEPDFGGFAFISLRYVPTLLVYGIGGMVALHPSMADLGAYQDKRPFTWRPRRELLIVATVYVPLIVTTYHGSDPILRMLGWIAVALIIARYWLIGYRLFNARPDALDDPRRT